MFAIIGPNLPEETEIHGWMLPANDPDIPNTCNFPSGGISFVMGTNISWASPKQRVSYILGINKTPLIAAERDGDKIYFDIDVFNENGNLAVRIEKNQFHKLSMQRHTYRRRHRQRDEQARPIPIPGDPDTFQWRPNVELVVGPPRKKAPPTQSFQENALPTIIDVGPKLRPIPDSAFAPPPPAALRSGRPRAYGNGRGA
jgi:hypothetical protein